MTSRTTEVVGARDGLRRARLTVASDVDAVTLGFERATDEGRNLRLVLDDQYSHARRG
jgi:hypothetical protein